MTDGLPDSPPTRVLIETEDVDGRTVLVPVATNAVLSMKHRRSDDVRGVLRDGYLRASRVLVEQIGDDAPQEMPGDGVRWIRVQEDA